MSRGTGKTCTSRVALPCSESVTLSCAPYYVFAICNLLTSIYKITSHVLLRTCMVDTALTMLIANPQEDEIYPIYNREEFQVGLDL